ncbi:MAG: D-glycero-beta-D-manno-heptose 1-phosphate adenylyltransferase [Calditrichaeota bacterium]|nr:MAG: D-glycero-beta-D-manno-heptose 1-phosphate adenylyltransferase [Calditrichota bacterium]
MVKNNIIPQKDVTKLIKKLKHQRKKIVFTNGVFDILHRGHVEYLARAKSFGDVLILGLNSDASVRRLKGNSRPLNKQLDRAIVLLALESVDYIIYFGQDTPLKLIQSVRPDVLVKGADYKISEIVGADFVKANGGIVKRVKFLKGRSTSKIIKKL